MRRAVWFIALLFPALGADYYAAPVPGPGAGTLASPFGLVDLPPAGKPGTGKALATLQPGDTLYLRAGEYHFTGHPTSGYDTPIISPLKPGTDEAPITIASAPGELAVLIDDGGVNPLAGSKGKDHVRFVGLELRPGGKSAALRFTGTAAKPLAGIEVAHCRVIGQPVATFDNHDGIRIDYARSPWVHHCEIRGVLGSWINSAGIKTYRTDKLLIEDCLIVDCTGGVFPKWTDTNAIVRRCVLARCDRPVVANSSEEPASLTVEDCSIEGQPIRVGGQCEIVLRNNRVFSTGLLVIETQAPLALHFEGNTLISPTNDIKAIEAKTRGWVPPGQPGSVFATLDRNTYLVRDGTPARVTVEFGAYRPADERITLTLADLRALGLERSGFIAGDGGPDLPASVDTRRFGPGGRPKVLPVDRP